MTDLYPYTHLPSEAYVPWPKPRRRFDISALIFAGLALLGFVVLLVCSAAAEHQKRCEMPFHTGLICGDE